MKGLLIRLLAMVAGIASLALIAGAVMLALRLAQPPEDPIDRSRDPAGEVAGRVAKVESGTILISSESPGSGLVPLVLTRDTAIMVGSTAGWPADIRPGGQIKAVYDLYQGKRLARSVQVLTEQPARHADPIDPPPRPAVTQKLADQPKPGPQPVAAEKAPIEPARPAAVEPKARSEPPAPRARTEPSPKAPLPSPAPSGATPQRAVHAPPAPARPAPPPAVAAPASPPASAPQPAAAPSPRSIGEPMPKASPAPAPTPTVAAPPGPAPPSPAAAAPSPLPASRPTPPPVRTQEPTRSPDSDATDGSAAVDWLLKGRR